MGQIVRLSPIWEILNDFSNIFLFRLGQLLSTIPAYLCGYTPSQGWTDDSYTNQDNKIIIRCSCEHMGQMIIFLLHNMQVAGKQCHGQEM